MKIRFFLISILLVLILAAGCDKKSPTESESDSNGNTEAITTWIYSGTTYTVRTVLAKADSFFDDRGLSVYFMDETMACDALKSSLWEKNYVKVFFPEPATGTYSKPKSVWFHSLDQSFQEMSTTGYPGELTSVDLVTERMVKGWVKLENIGLNDDATIAGSFEASYCPE